MIHALHELGGGTGIFTGGMVWLREGWRWRKHKKEKARKEKGERDWKRTVLRDPGDPWMFSVCKMSRYILEVMGIPVEIWEGVEF